MVVTFPLLDGSDYVVALKNDADPDRAWLERTRAVNLTRWQ
jgi:hypothetical protein